MTRRNPWRPKFNTTYSADGRSPYMTRLVWNRLRYHVFHRGDEDPDPHDHPWGFWTFPFTSYVEEVTERDAEGTWRKRQAVVRAWRIHARPASHTHRVLGRWSGKGTDTRPGRIHTVVWTTMEDIPWGFLKERDGVTCWLYWKDYILKGGKALPCPTDEAPPRIQA